MERHFAPTLPRGPVEGDRLPVLHTPRRSGLEPSGPIVRIEIVPGG